MYRSENKETLRTVSCMVGSRGMNDPFSFFVPLWCHADLHGLKKLDIYNRDNMSRRAMGGGNNHGSKSSRTKPLSFSFSNIRWVSSNVIFSSFFHGGFGGFISVPGYPHPLFTVVLYGIVGGKCTIFEVEVLFQLIVNNMEKDNINFFEIVEGDFDLILQVVCDIRYLILLFDFFHKLSEKNIRIRFNIHDAYCWHMEIEYFDINLDFDTSSVGDIGITRCCFQPINFGRTLDDAHASKMKRYFDNKMASVYYASRSACVRKLGVSCKFDDKMFELYDTEEMLLRVVESVFLYITALVNLFIRNDRIGSHSVVQKYFKYFGKSDPGDNGFGESIIVNNRAYLDSSHEFARYILGFILFVYNSVLLRADSKTRENLMKLMTFVKPSFFMNDDRIRDINTVKDLIFLSVFFGVPLNTVMNYEKDSGLLLCGRSMFLLFY